MRNNIQFTVGICAYNEEANIGNLIKAIQKQKLGKKLKLKEIIIVASGCTDNTISIIKSHAIKNKRIVLLIQKKREGKAMAVNIVLEKVKSDYLIMESADTIPDYNCYRLLLNKLQQEDVGLAAGRIVPKDNPDTFIGFANCLKWKLHHEINLEYPSRPKVGELIAFKKIFTRIPPNTAVDEASIEPIIHLQGFKIVYVPKALIYNLGPQTLREYLSRRRSIYAGHFLTKKKYSYEIVTLSTFRMIKVTLKNLKFSSKFLLYTFGVVLLELIARISGYLDVQLNLRDLSIWKISETSKRLEI